MKRIIYTLLVLVAAIGFSSCQNDGHIGALFGTWRVESYSLNGETVDIKWPTTFSFEGEVVQAAANIDSYGTTWQRFGSWAESDGVLTLNFTHSDGNTPQGTGIYAAPEWLGMTSRYAMEMQSVISGKNMSLSWTDRESNVHKYTLHKTW